MLCLSVISCVKHHELKVPEDSPQGAQAPQGIRLSYYSRKKIGQVFKNNRQKLRACLDKFRSKMNTKEAFEELSSLILYVTLKSNGKVQAVGLNKTNWPLELKMCLVSKVWPLRFPKVSEKGPFVIKQPFYFY